MSTPRMPFQKDQRGFTGAERALLICFGLGLVTLAGHLLTSGSKAAADQAHQTLLTRTGGTRLQAISAMPMAAPAAAPAAPEGEAFPPEKVLNITWQGQETDHYCGPASTRMALSALTNDLPSQDTLARALGTTGDGTNHIGLIQNTLNSQLGTTFYETKVMNNPPTAEQRDLLRRDLLFNLNKGYPIVANVVSGWRPPGYPGGTIYHYVTVVGYDQGGDRVLIADPAGACSAGPSWCNVPQMYWISTQDLGTWIGGKGYAA